MKLPSLHPICSLLLLLSIPSAVALAQAPEADGDTEPEGTFFESVSVEVVDIEVFVTNKQGEPVRGLTEADFELLVDERPATLSNFLAVEGRSRGREDRLPPPPTDSAPTPSQAPETADVSASGETARPPANQPLHLIIYVDNLNIRPENRRWVTGQMRRIVPTLVREGDAVLLATYDRRVIVRQPFTTDSQKILSAMDEVDMLTAGGAAIDLDRRRALEEIDATEYVGSGFTAARSHADYLSSELRFSLAGLSELISSLAGIPGRKALLYVSDGLPLIAAEELFAAVDERFGMNSGLSQAFTYDFGREFSRLATLANSNGVTFYTLDAKGLQTDELSGADTKALVNIRSRVRIDATRKQNLAAPLRILAEDTGGQAIIGTNAVIPALERVVEDFKSYYSLGYTPATADGRFHKLEVRVKGRPELTVRHRNGFRLKDPQSRLLDAAQAAVEYGIERRGLGAWVEFQQPAPHDGGLWRLPTLVRIPIGALTLIPSSDASLWVGRIQVAVGTYAPNGDRAPAQNQPSHRIEIPAADLERAKASFYTYELQLIVRGGSQRVSVGVRDEVSGVVDAIAEIVTIQE